MNSLLRRIALPWHGAYANGLAPNACLLRPRLDKVALPASVVLTLRRALPQLILMSFDTCYYCCDLIAIVQRKPIAVLACRAFA